jgi:arabinofuranosyltransferase
VTDEPQSEGGTGSHGCSGAGRAAALLLLAAASAVFLAESWVRHAQLDDAYISYRYANNLVSGSGLVYNPGERVEGITNLLWALLVAGGVALGLRAHEVGHGLGLVSGVAVLAASALYAGSGLARSRLWLAGLAPWIVLSSIPFVLWSTSGMETPLFAAATTAALAAQVRGRTGWATLAALVATWVRPDGVLIAAVIFGFHVVRHRSQGWRSWAWPAVYAAGVLALTGFRIAYYGSPVPNTFHAKVGGIPVERGLDYLFDFLRGGAGVLLVPAVVAVARDRRWWPGAAFCVVLALYVVAIGGDVFPHGRFLLPALPCLAVLAVRGAAEAYDGDRYAGILVSLSIPVAVGWQIFGTIGPLVFAGVVLLAVAWVAALALRRRWIGVAAAATVAAAALAFALADRDAARDAMQASWRAQELKRVRTGFGMLERMGFMRAEVLRSRGDPVRLVAGGAIGSFGFFSGLPIVDLYGLVDPEIARSDPEVRADSVVLPGHQRSNAAIIFARRPDYILIPKPDAWVSELLPANVEITSHPDLDAHYEWDPEVWGYRRKPATPARSEPPRPTAAP